MMAFLIFSILSLIAATLVISAVALSSRLSRHEDWIETYDSTESSSNSSTPLHAQTVKQ